MAADPRDELARAFVTSARALAGIAIRSLEAAPVSVTVPQHRVLVLLSEGPLAVGTIAVQLGVNPSNATRLCDRLQRMDLVERSRSAQDGREVQVTITEAGRALVDEVFDYRRRAVAEVLGDLPPEQARAAVEAMTAFNEAASRHSSAEAHDGSW
jgi:DNA-binding MarR family transcriptional regulator